MTKWEYNKLCYAMGSIMNGEPGYEDHNPRYGLFDDGMSALADIREAYMRKKLHKRVLDIETAHKNAGKSKLVFKKDKEG